MEKMVIIGGSAGSLDAMLKLLPKLKAGLQAAIIIVLHRKTTNDNILVDLFSAKTVLPVKEIEEKEKAMPGNIYIVPADYHLLIEQDETFTLDLSERVNYSRPSIDVVFESAAHVYRSRLACILLSGANADGTEGLKYVRAQGGLAIAQDPATAEVEYMPAHAIQQGATDHVWNVDEMAVFLNGDI